MVYGYEIVQPSILPLCFPVLLSANILPNSKINRSESTEMPRAVHFVHYVNRITSLTSPTKRGRESHDSDLIFHPKLWALFSGAMAFSLLPVLLHCSAAAIMAWGFHWLNRLPLISKQYGWHYPALTVLGLVLCELIQADSHFPILQASCRISGNDRRVAGGFRTFTQR